MVNRYLRNSLIFEKWGKRLVTENVLDVGCDIASMRNKYITYIGIDVSGDPDIKINLEKKKIPFKKNSFQVVMCNDVLEHLDNMHSVLEQIVNIAREFIILSFPNELRWSNLFSYMNNVNNREFGFNPKNRHKWFLSYSQSRNFMKKFANKKKLEIYGEYVDLGGIGKITHGILKNKFPNLMPYSYYIVLKKKIII